MLVLYTHTNAAGLYADYLQGNPQALQFMGNHFTQNDLYAEKCGQIAAGYRHDREQVAEMLLFYNRQVGCGRETEAQIAKLRDPRAVAVVCGQQAGLLTGPLYTVYKALAAVKVAAKLQAQLNRPVVPLFWIASEDNDFSEANHCYIHGADQKTTRIDLPLTHRGEPVGRLELTEKAGRAVLEQLQANLTNSEFVPELLQWLDEFRRQSDTPVDWFARIMHKLFSAYGLVLYDPLLADGRALALPLLREAVQRHEELETALCQREASLLQAGYKLQVRRQQSSTLFMIMKDRRTALFCQDGVYQTRDGSLRYRESELLAMLASEPGLLGPNVLLRPLVQDCLFPTAAVILGPGETAYYAQALSLYPLFKIPAPVLIPRPGLTVVEPRLARHIRRYQIPDSMLIHRLPQYLDQLLADKSTVDLEEIFTPLRRLLAEEYQGLETSLSHISTQLGELAAKNLQHIYSQIGFLEEKARQEVEKQHEVMIRHFAQLQEGFLPLYKPQERVLTVTGFLAKYGPAWWEQLASEFPDNGTHYLYYP